MSLYVTHLTFVNQGEEDTLVSFESKVLPLLKRYNAEVVLRVRPGKENIIEASIEQPFEIHLIRFASEPDLKNYLADPERQSLLPLKEKATKTTMTFLQHLTH